MAGQTPVVHDWLRSTYSMELGLIPVLEDQLKGARSNPQTQKMVNQHLEQTRQHALMLKGRLERLGEGVSTIKPSNAIATIYGKTKGDGQDTVFKDKLIGFVTESFEVASYKALVAAAKQAGDNETVRIAQQILHEEEQMVHWLDEDLPETRLRTAPEVTKTDENIRLARASLDAFNAHDLSTARQHQASDFRQESPGSTSALNSEQAREVSQSFITAFPDLHLAIERTIAQGNYVVFHWLGTGTHLGPLVGPKGSSLPPTRKKARVPGSTTYEIKNGKIARQWDHWDMTTLLEQLGGLPQPQG